MPTRIVFVDPAELRVPPSRPYGADPGKLQRQIAAFGISSAGMPTPCFFEGTDGVLMLYERRHTCDPHRQTFSGDIDSCRDHRSIENTARPTSSNWRFVAMTSTRQQILHALEELSELTSEVRFGQLIANLSYLAIGPTAEAIWDMEDEQLLNAIQQHIADLSQRHSQVASSRLSGVVGSLSVG